MSASPDCLAIQASEGSACRRKLPLGWPIRLCLQRCSSPPPPRQGMEQALYGHAKRVWHMVVVRTDCPLGTYRYQRFETQELQDFGQICTLDLPLVHKFGFSPLPNKEMFGTLGYKPVSRLTTHTDVNAVGVFARSCGSVCNKPPLHVNLPPDQSCRRGQVHVEPAGRSEGGERERGVGTSTLC